MSMSPASQPHPHAPWIVILAGVSAALHVGKLPPAIPALQADLGCRASDLRAGIGPSIGPCCCEMGPEVLEQFRAAWPETDALCTPLGGGRALLDLWRLNALQLERAGVTQIETAGVCTVCNMHDYYSHRGENGATGRFGALIGLR